MAVQDEDFSLRCQGIVHHGPEAGDDRPVRLGGKPARQALPCQEQRRHGVARLHLFRGQAHEPQGLASLRLRQTFLGELCLPMSFCGLSLRHTCRFGGRLPLPEGRACRQQQDDGGDAGHHGGDTSHPHLPFPGFRKLLHRLKLLLPRPFLPFVSLDTPCDELPLKVFAYWQDFCPPIPNRQREVLS